MKKLFAGILTAALLAGAMAGVTACGGNDRSKQWKTETLEVYSPDGAPALALCKAIAEEDKKEDELFDFEIIDTSRKEIATFVTGAVPKADICILPVNAAAKVLGQGTVYQMLGTVTNGNLYFLTTGTNAELTSDTLSTLVGKKVGVVQLRNVPGLTLQVVLRQKGIAYQTIESAQASGDPEKVNLVPFIPDDVSPAGGCDYYLCPEPAASAKIKGREGKPQSFKMAGDLQAFYGAEGGYPQAAVVAKKSAIENYPEHIETFLGYLEGSAAFLQNATVSEILHLLDEEREDGVTPSFSEKNLTKEVVSRCSVRFTPSKNCKDKVVSFLGELMEVDPSFTATPADAFFYMG